MNIQEIRSNEPWLGPRLSQSLHLLNTPVTSSIGVDLGVRLLLVILRALLIVVRLRDDPGAGFDLVSIRHGVLRLRLDFEQKQRGMESPKEIDIVDK